MDAMFRGFLGRDRCHLALRCRAFSFDPREDLIRGISDPGTYRQAHVLLRPYLRTHRHAVVVLDNDWNGSPGVERIRNDISHLLRINGWESDRSEVIVIDPELEAWLWQESPHIDTAFRYTGAISLRQWLSERGMWADGSAKPARPKEAVKAVSKSTGVPQSAAVYRRIAEKVSVAGCTDPAFAMLCQALRRWFPEGAAI
jgi:hypothetical protein